jgi:hypothetical protein
MRRYWVVALAVLTLLGVLSPPVWAQAPAAPTPKVTITGLVDNLANFSRNMSQFDLGLGGVTNPDDDGMHARTRGRFDVIGELGKAKAVLGLEIDLAYGQVAGADNSDSGFITNQVFGTSGGFDANTDTLSVIEVKWMYVEFPFSGPGSLLPFIPWAGTMTVGGQPYALGLKPSILADSDFGGATIRMTISPTLDFSLTYAQLEEENVGHHQHTANATGLFGRGDDWGIIFKANWQATKELKVSPIYAFQEIQGTTSAGVRRGVGGYPVAAANFAPDIAVGAPGLVTPCLPGQAVGIGENIQCKPTEELRHWIGVDARWSRGPLYIAPTAFYQFGSRERMQTATDPHSFGAATRRKTADISAWIADVEAGYRMGPLFLQTRAMYTSGNKASDNLNEEIRYYQPFQVDSTYFFGWGETTPLSSIDYFQGLYTAVGAYFEGNNIGYDRYGRAQFSVKGTYDWTPQLSIWGVVTPMWTARSVPTDRGAIGATGITCRSEVNFPGSLGLGTPCTRRDETGGSDSYLGTDLAAGFTWRFAPGLTFDWVYGVLIAGSALDTNRFVQFTPAGAGALGVERFDSENVYTTTARVRYQF